MSVAAGSRLGPYEIQSLIGAGGMGEVYRARDTRLERTVALKILRPELANDLDRRARFEREAHAIAALSHPHICTLHDIGTESGTTYLVMEHLAGDTLAERLAKGPLPLAQVLDLGAQIAEGLAAAHKAGIVHRDLKPANIMLVRGPLASGPPVVKLLDFGLAKLTGHGEAPAATLATTAAIPASLTGRGTIVGTLPYMAPEQVQGQETDARTDIWALGAILYEMVTGSRAFEASSAVSLIGAILEREPASLAARQPLTPPSLDRTIRRCLAKHPDERWDSAHDVADELRWIGQERSRPRRITPLRAGGVWWAAVPLLIAGVVSAYLWFAPSRGVSPLTQPVRVVPVTTLSGTESQPTLSPDGDQVAFRWDGERHDNDDVYLTLVGSQVIRRLTTDPAYDGSPIWSPDGRQLAFVRCSEGLGGCRIFLTSPLGGPERRLSDFPATGRLSWSPDGRYLAVVRGSNPPAATAGAIHLVTLDGGGSRRLTAPETRSPAFSPNGRRLAYASCRSELTCDLYVLELDAEYRPVRDPHRITNDNTMILSLAWARDGRTIVYETQPVADGYYLRRIDAQAGGQSERIEMAGLGARAPALAPTRDRLVFQRMLLDIDIHALVADGTSRRVLGSSFSELQPTSSPDGRHIAFCTSRSGESVEIWVANADGAEPRQLTYGPGRWQCSPQWSPDGHRIAFDSQLSDGFLQVFTIDTDGGPARQVTSGKTNSYVPSWSRDGRWIYHRSERSGRPDIWRVAADGGQPQRVTQGVAGKFACESADGKNLLFQPKDADSPLMTMPLGGGAPSTLLGCVRATAFSVGPRGIYYVGCGSEQTVHVLDPTSGEDRVFGRIEQTVHAPFHGLAVSRNGASVFYSKVAKDGADLMMIENFR